MSEIKDIYDGFNSFKEIFLKNKKSIFSDNMVFTEDNLKKIIAGFVKNPDESEKKSFDEKIKKQLGNTPEVHELFAHIIWLWSLVASDMKQESKIQDINKWLSDDKKIDKDFSYSFEHGIMSTGQYHKTNKPLELIYIIYFLEKVLQNPEKDYIQIIKEGVKAGIEPFEMNFENGTPRKVAMYNILLHLFKPDYYLSIASFKHKEKIVDFFSKQLKIEFEKNDDLDDKLYKVKQKCLEEYGDKYPYKWDDIYKKYEFNKLDFYNSDLEKYWKNDIVLEAKNMILHGAPGTGKTYSVENTIKNRLEFLQEQNSQKQFKLVQFHPSYSYEDFIDGIKPDGISENGNMKFKLVNGEFKKMCIEAAKELENNPNNSKQFYFIADEVNRAELSRVFGELLLCLEEDKRLKYVDGKWQGTKVKTQNANLWKKEEHAVIIEDGEGYFGVPENLYFIGTMNDIDRSVDSFDMALRRRFFWKQYRCDYDVIYEHFRTKKDYPENLDIYIKKCKNLNEKITSEKDLNLGDSYELGHSYFMKINAINNTQIKKLWESHISPLLKEYLRAELSQNEIDKKLKELQKEFRI